MKSIIRWAVNNSPAMNTVMVGLLVVGAASMLLMRREVFPEFDLEIILVTVPYPGASPAEVEEGICQKIEEAVRAIDGIKKQTSVAQEGGGFVIIEIETSVDAQKVLNEIRSEVDRIPSFPILAEDPEVEQLTLREPAIMVSIIGPDSRTTDSALALREVAEQVRDELLQLSSVTQANITGSRDYQIDIEIPETTLRKHGLSLQQVAAIVRRENIELPGGTMKSDTQQVLLRSKNKRMIGEDISKIPLVTQSDGVVLTIDDLGSVRDEFVDETAISEINSHPGLTISIDAAGDEDLLEIARQVRGYVEGDPDHKLGSFAATVNSWKRWAGIPVEDVESFRHVVSNMWNHWTGDPAVEKAIESTLPPGYEVRYWRDSSVDVKDRMDLLAKNGLQGLALVFIVLAVFLDLRLAFWVAMGIPVAVLGSGIYLWMTGETLNMLSMFAFLMALGIVVDDAIVIGENIYAHRQRGSKFVDAAINGAYEVLPSVGASVATTMIMFAPLLFVSGIMGKFIAVMPVAVIAMLAISLVECITVLPCHLSHDTNLFLKILGFILYPFRIVGDLFKWINKQMDRILGWFIDNVYSPGLRWGLRRPEAIVSFAILLLLIVFGMVGGGWTKWELMPPLDSNWIEAKVTYPDGTPAEIADGATKRIEAAIFKINEKYDQLGVPVVRLVSRQVGTVSTPGMPGPDGRATGSHVGSVFVEMYPNSVRTVNSDTIIEEWRKSAGDFPGVEQITYGSPAMGPGGNAIEFKLIAQPEHMNELEEAVDAAKEELSKHDKVVDIRDDSLPGKWEYRLRVKDRALAMGVTAADLGETVRASYYGEEVMRLQRGRHEVKLMVRYPQSDRKSIAEFDEIRVRAGGVERPLPELAEVEVARGYSEINRVEQQRSITVTADTTKDGNSRQITEVFDNDLQAMLKKDFPNVSVRWEGEKKDSAESLGSLGVGFIIALLAIYVLLTVEFRSYLQPILIMAIIPFGIVGAVFGHAFLWMTFTIFSMFGLVALTGVVINDSIVLIDFINGRVAEGRYLFDAVLEAGRRRFRPVLLTSVTTIAGLLPLLTERSFQAQVLIPMAVSMAFGLMLATVLVLVLIPVFYSIYGRLVGMQTEAGPTSPENSPPLPHVEVVPPKPEPAIQAEVVASAKRLASD